MSSSPTPPSVGRAGVYWSLVAFVLAAISGLALNLVIEQRYDTESLGRFNLSLAVFLIGGQVGSAGIQSAVLYHTPRARALGQSTGAVLQSALRVSLATSLAAVTVVVGGGVTLLALLGADEFRSSLVAIGPGLLLYPLSKALLAHINGLRRIRLFSLLFATRYLLLMGLVGSLAASGASDRSLPWAISVAEGVLFVVLVVVLRHELRPTGEHERLERELLRFGLRGMVGGLLLDLNTRVDILILGVFAGSDATGRYSVASGFAEGLYQLSLATRSSYDPLVATLFVEHRYDELRETLARARRRVYLMIAPLGLLTIAVYPLAVRLLFDRELAGDTWAIYAVLAGGIVASAGYIPFTSLLQQTGHPRDQSFLLGFVSLTNIVGNLALVPFLGPIGSAIGTAAAQVLFVVYHRMLCRQRLGWAI